MECLEPSFFVKFQDHDRPLCKIFVWALFLSPFDHICFIYVQRYIHRVLAGVRIYNYLKLNLFIQS